MYGLEPFTTTCGHVHVITDYKPLISVGVKPMSRAPKHLQSMLFEMQTYNNTPSINQVLTFHS